MLTIRTDEVKVTCIISKEKDFKNKRALRETNSPGDISDAKIFARRSVMGILSQLPPKERLDYHLYLKFSWFSVDENLIPRHHQEIKQGTIREFLTNPL